MRRFENNFLLAVIALALTLGSQLTSAADLHLFTARYQVRFYGVSGGVLQLTLRKGNEPNEYIYESRAEPSFLGSFMVSDAARESSTMLIDAMGVRPTQFLSDDGKKGDEKDSNVRFDWTQNRIIGRSERVDFNQELPPHIQDHLSIQIAVIKALQDGAELGDFALIDAGEIKNYTYTKEGGGTIKFKGRVLDATIVRSERANSPGGRINRYWHAAELGNLPVRAERSRGGKIDLTMDLVDVKFSS
jgi:hypothetical protein